MFHYLFTGFPLPKPQPQKFLAKTFTVKPEGRCSVILNTDSIQILGYETNESEDFLIAVPVKRHFNIFTGVTCLSKQQTKQLTTTKFKCKLCDLQMEGLFASAIAQHFKRNHKVDKKLIYTLLVDLSTKLTEDYMGVCPAPLFSYAKSAVHHVVCTGCRLLHDPKDIHKCCKPNLKSPP